MNAAFPPEDPAKQLGGVYPADPTASLLLDQQQQQQAQQASRTQTPSGKRSRDDEESEGESEGNSKGDGKDEKRAGRRKIKIEYIEDKSRRHITFSKRKAGIMKKAFELSTLTGTQVLLLVVSETGLVYTFTTPKLQPIVTKPEGKNLIQACLNAPELPDANNQVVQPTPTESNSYMSQPRQAYAANAAQVAPSVIPGATAAGQDAATAAAAAAAAAQSMSGADNGFDRKLHSGSPAGVNHATASYLQQYYNGQQAVVAAAAGMPGAYSSNNSMGAYAAAVAGYGSYPGSNNHSQHHSPIAANVAPHTPQPVNGISAAVAAAASNMPTMGGLASYHHQAPGQQQAHPNFHSSQSQTPTQGLSTPGTPSVSSTSVSAAVAAAVAAANGGHAP
ncbi:transcription factor of the MADS box, partial [Linderina macrospora]